MRDFPFIARMAGTVTFFRSALFIISSGGPRRRAWRTGNRACPDRRDRLSSTTSWSRSVDSGSKRYVVLSSLLSVSNLLHELVEMLGCVNEIDVGCIHHQQRRLVV